MIKKNEENHTLCVGEKLMVSKAAATVRLKHHNWSVAAGDGLDVESNLLQP